MPNTAAIEARQDIIEAALQRVLEVLSDDHAHAVRVGLLAHVGDLPDATSDATDVARAGALVALLAALDR